jgi:hypothetical protein
MKRRILLSLILSLAVGISACGDDDPPADGNNGNNNNGADVGPDADLDADPEPDAEPDADPEPDAEPDADPEPDAEPDADPDVGPDAEPDADPTPTVSILADDQFLAAADSNTVWINTVNSEGPGWAVVHETEGDGSTGAIIGHAAVSDGESTDVEVTLDRDVVDGETLVAMLHVDEGTEGDFEPDGDDGPALDDNDDPVVDDFVVTLPKVEPAATQTLSDLSTVITIDSVLAKGDSWIVIHENECANFGAVIGHAAVSDGQNDDVEVTLERPATADEDLCAMLHIEDPADGEYTFGDDPSEDPPAALADSGDVIMETFNVQLQDADDIPAIRITIASGDGNDYTFGDVEPAALDEGMAGKSDPTVYLNQGWRYEIVNNAGGAHPFEFVATTVGTGGDSIVLSQNEQGSGEGNADTNWSDDGTTMRFNVAGPAFDGTVTHGGAERYQCSEHAAMTGDIILQ